MAKNYTQISVKQETKDRLDYWKRKGRVKSLDILISQALEYYIKAYNHDSLNNDAVIMRLNQLITQTQANTKAIELLKQSTDQGFGALFGFDDDEDDY